MASGALPRIDEECGLRNGSDDNLLRKIVEHHKGGSVLRHAGPRRPDAFAVAHYAGEVRSRVSDARRIAAMISANILYDLGEYPL